MDVETGSVQPMAADPIEANPERMIDAVIFDFAGVLSTSPALGMIARAADFDVDLGAMSSVMLGPLDVDSDHPWHRLERGEITTGQYAADIEPLWRATGATSFPSLPRGEELLEVLQPVPEMIATARDVRVAGYRTAILTNNMREVGECGARSGTPTGSWTSSSTPARWVCASRTRRSSS